MRNANEIAKEIKEIGTWDMEPFSIDYSLFSRKE